MKKRLKYALLCGALLLLGGGVALGLRFYSGIARDPMRAFTEPSPLPRLCRRGSPCLPLPSAPRSSFCGRPIRISCAAG